MKYEHLTGLHLIAVCYTSCSDAENSSGESLPPALEMQWSFLIVNVHQALLSRAR